MHDEEHEEPTPTWVKIAGALALLLVAILVVLHLTGNDLGGHAP